MKRDPALEGLSREHHHALVLARRARWAAAEAGAPVAAVWSEVEDRFATEIGPHFDLEDLWLLPALAAAGEQYVVAQIHAEHQALRALVVGPRSVARLAEFGVLLAAHVRFEERIVFPLAERRFSREALDAIAAACAHAAFVGGHAGGHVEAPGSAPAVLSTGPNRPVPSVEPSGSGGDT